MQKKKKKTPQKEKILFGLYTLKKKTNTFCCEFLLFIITQYNQEKQNIL